MTNEFVTLHLRYWLVFNNARISLIFKISAVEMQQTISSYYPQQHLFLIMWSVSTNVPWSKDNRWKTRFCLGLLFYKLMIKSLISYTINGVCSCSILFQRTYVFNLFIRAIVWLGSAFHNNDYQVIFLDSNMMILYPVCKNNILSIIHLPGKVLCHIEGGKSVYVSQGWLFKQNHITTLYLKSAYIFNL